MLDTRSRWPISSPTRWAPAFDCRTFKGSTGVHVAVRGDLDFTTVCQVDRALRLGWALSDVLVLDLRELTYIDASGGRLVLEANRRIQRAGGRLTTVRGPTELDCWLKLFGTEQTVDLVDQPPDANDDIPAQNATRWPRLAVIAPEASAA